MTSHSTPKQLSAKCVVNEIRSSAMKESLAAVAEGLWSMLSSAEVRNTPFFKLGGQTIPSFSYCRKTADKQLYIAPVIRDGQS